MPRKDIAIAELAQGPIEHSRAHLDSERVAYYMGTLDEAPPVVVFDIGGHLLLADGYHRVAAAEQLGRTSVPADVRVGDRGDALRFAVRLAQQQRGLAEDEVLAAIMRRCEDRGAKD